MDIPLHTVLHNQVAGENGIQDVDFTVVDPQGGAQAGIQVEGADQVIIDAQRLHQLHLAAFLLHLFPGFLQFLLGVIQ